MKKILIADDMPGWVKFHVTNIKALKIPGISIDTANSGMQALEKIENNLNKPYTTIFTDLQMESDFLPKPAGIWLIERIQDLKQYNKTKVVIVSATPSIERIAKCYNVSFISKAIARNSDCEIYREFI